MIAQRGVVGPGIEIAVALDGPAAALLTRESLEFVAFLQRGFSRRRAEVLNARTRRQQAFDRGSMPEFLSETAHVRADPDWQVARHPGGGAPCRVELIGPADRDSLAEGLSSGADLYIADFEDATTPSWADVAAGQACIRDLIGSESKGTTGRQRTALAIRPRNWSRLEQHLRIDGEACSAALFDFGLFLFHNARRLAALGKHPFVCLAKLESRHEAALWNDVFCLAQDELGIPRATIKAVCDIETLGAALEMEEILYELREHSAGLHAGSRNFVFSVLRALRTARDLGLPGEFAADADLPCVASMRRMVVDACRRRGTCATAATPGNLPVPGASAANEAALTPVARAVARLSAEGCGGMRLAHPGQIAAARTWFNSSTAVTMNPAGTMRAPATTTCDLLEVGPASPFAAAMIRRNCELAIRYLGIRLAGRASTPIFNRMTDASTFDCIYALLWHLQRSAVAVLDDGRKVDAALIRKASSAALKTILAESGNRHDGEIRWNEAATLFGRMCVDEQLENMSAFTDPA